MKTGKMSEKLLPMALCTVLAAAFCCFPAMAAEEEEETAGRYDLAVIESTPLQADGGVTTGPITISSENFEEYGFEGEAYLDLAEDGSGELIFFGESVDITWDETEISSEDGEYSYAYTLGAGVLSFSSVDDNTEVTYVFVKEGAIVAVSAPAGSTDFEVEGEEYFVISSAITNGTTMDLDQLAEDGIDPSNTWIVLREDGTSVFAFQGSSEILTYADGSLFEGEDEVGNYALEGEVLHIDILNMIQFDMTLTDPFEYEEPEADEESEAEEVPSEAEEASLSELWNGTWCCWFEASFGEGEFENLDGMLDMTMTAEVNVDENGSGSLALYYYYSPYIDEDPWNGEAVLTAQITADEDTITINSWESENEEWMADDWYIYRVQVGSSSYVAWSGTYTTDDGSFDYSFTMRKWGGKWPLNGTLPYGYEEMSVRALQESMEEYDSFADEISGEEAEVWCGDYVGYLYVCGAAGDYAETIGSEPMPVSGLIAYDNTTGMQYLEVSDGLDFTYLSCYIKADGNHFALNTDVEEEENWYAYIGGPTVTASIPAEKAAEYTTWFTPDENSEKFEMFYTFTDPENEENTVSLYLILRREGSLWSYSRDMHYQGDYTVGNEEIENIRSNADESGDLLAVEYLGTYDGDYDGLKSFLTDVMKYTWEIDEEHFVSAAGEEVYAIVPAKRWCAVEIYGAELDEDGNLQKTDLLYTGAGDPVIVRGNASDIIPDLIVCVTTEEGETLEYSPFLSLENGELSQAEGVYDNTNYWVDDMGTNSWDDTWADLSIYNNWTYDDDNGIVYILTLSEDGTAGYYEFDGDLDEGWLEMREDGPVYYSTEDPETAQAPSRSCAGTVTADPDNGIITISVSSSEDPDSVIEATYHAYTNWWNNILRLQNDDQDIICTLFW